MKSQWFEFSDWLPKHATLGPSQWYWLVFIEISLKLQSVNRNLVDQRLRWSGSWIFQHFNLHPQLLDNNNTWAWNERLVLGIATVSSLVLLVSSFSSGWGICLIASTLVGSGRTPYLVDGPCTVLPQGAVWAFFLFSLRFVSCALCSRCPRLASWSCMYCSSHPVKPPGYYQQLPRHPGVLQLLKAFVPGTPFAQNIDQRAFWGIDICHMVFRALSSMSSAHPARLGENHP